MANSNLTKAKKAKNDEFYTQYADIEKEMTAYREYDPNVFRDKIILLPCDDPEWSNFTKRAGQQLESWEQESAIAIIKRLQIANKACSVAWTLMRRDSPEAQEVKELLVRFSGRQMKRKGQITAPALMDGLCMLMSCLQILKNHSIEELNHMASIALHGFDLGKEIKP